MPAELLVLAGIGADAMVASAGVLTADRACPSTGDDEALTSSGFADNPDRRDNDLFELVGRAATAALRIVGAPDCDGIRVVIAVAAAGIGSVAGIAAVRTMRRTTPVDSGGTPDSLATGASCGPDSERRTARGAEGVPDAASSAGETAAATRGAGRAASGGLLINSGWMRRVAASAGAVRDSAAGAWTGASADAGANAGVDGATGTTLG